MELIRQNKQTKGKLEAAGDYLLVFRVPAKNAAVQRALDVQRAAAHLDGHSWIRRSANNYSRRSHPLQVLLSHLGQGALYLPEPGLDAVPPPQEIPGLLPALAWQPGQGDRARPGMGPYPG